jgi:peptide/nickel transport system ATP-binding protein/oligopeptide transport system ATP-binding protein
VSEPVLVVDDLVKHYRVRGSNPFRSQTVQALNGVSFSIGHGETLAVVGESGSGKSTLGKTIMGFQRPTSGEVLFGGRDIAGLRGRRLRQVRRDMHFVFQDPYASLPTRRSVGDIIAEPMVIHGIGTARSRADDVAELLSLVGLRPELRDRYTYEISGGQRQRVSIARALALRPRLLILDEPISALDVSVQAQVINLLVRLQTELGLSYLFIAHDLAVVRNIAHRVAVMYLGRIVEIGDSDEVFTTPRHPYTRALLAAVPATDPADRGRRRRIRLDGDPPDPIDPPSGCAFRSRCWKAAPECAAVLPPLVATETSEAACIRLDVPDPADGAMRPA